MNSRARATLNDSITDHVACCRTSRFCMPGSARTALQFQVTINVVEEFHHAEARVGTGVSVFDYPDGISALGHIPAGRGRSGLQCRATCQGCQTTPDSGQRAAMERERPISLSDARLRIGREDT